MRLTEEERATILSVVGRATAGRGRVWLFGSRTDNAARGGDIDLIVESPHPVDHPAQLIAEIGTALEAALGEQHIDVLLRAPKLKSATVHDAAKSSGILL